MIFTLWCGKTSQGNRLYKLSVRTPPPAMASWRAMAKSLILRRDQEVGHEMALRYTFKTKHEEKGQGKMTSPVDYKGDRVKNGPITYYFL